MANFLFSIELKSEICHLVEHTIAHAWDGTLFRISNDLKKEGVI